MYQYITWKAHQGASGPNPNLWKHKEKAKESAAKSA
jgi:hypothetical protein